MFLSRLILAATGGTGRVGLSRAQALGSELFAVRARPSLRQLPAKSSGLSSSSSWLPLSTAAAAALKPSFPGTSEAMKLNNISDNKGARKKRKRVGRGIGSGWGKTCGRGHKVSPVICFSSVPASGRGGDFPVSPTQRIAFLTPFSTLAAFSSLSLARGKKPGVVAGPALVLREARRRSGCGFRRGVSIIHTGESTSG